MNAIYFSTFMISPNSLSNLFLLCSGKMSYREVKILRSSCMKSGLRGNPPLTPKLFFL